MAEYAHYLKGSPSGQGVGIASIGGTGATILGQALTTLTASGATRNILDDGSGNMTVAGTLTASSISGTFVGVPFTSAITLVSGTPQQNTFSKDGSYVIELSTTATAGTYTIAIGATSGANINLANAAKLTTQTSVLATIPVPSGYWINVTTATVVISQATFIGV